MPELTIVIGCNGAGKSTWCENHADALPADFYNPDRVAKGMGDWNSRSKQRAAGKVVRRLIHGHLQRKESFGFEATYAGRSTPRIVERASKLGYEVHAVFIGTKNPAINIERVAARVRNETGHNVATSDIRRRWRTAQENLATTADTINRIEVLDNSEGTSRVIGRIEAKRDAILVEPAPQWTKQLSADIEETRRTSKVNRKSPTG